MKHPLHDILIAIAEGKPVQYFMNNTWIDLNPNNQFHINPQCSASWRIKPKEKVKKYRWVINDYRNENTLKVTDHYYANLAEFNAQNMHGVWVAVEPIESTMIEVEVDD